MIYLILGAIIVALLVSHAVILFLPRSSFGVRFLVAVPIVFALYISSLWMLERLLTHRVVNLHSLLAWAIVAGVATGITFLVQLFLSNRRWRR